MTFIMGNFCPLLSLRCTICLSVIPECLGQKLDEETDRKNNYVPAQKQFARNNKIDLIRL